MYPTLRLHQVRIVFVLSVLTILICGCGTTNTRSATEQLLMSDAVDRAIGDLDFTPLANQKVYLDTTYLVPVKTIGFVNSQYIISAIRQQLIASNCLIQDDKSTADVIVEARVGALGTDGHEMSFGIPQSSTISSAAAVFSSSTGIPVIPEVSLARSDSQQAAAKIGVFAYNQATREPIWQSGIRTSRSHSKDTWILGAGPWQRGSIYSQPHFAGAPIGGKKVEVEEEKPLYLSEAIFKRKELESPEVQVANFEENVEADKAADSATPPAESPPAETPAETPPAETPLATAPAAEATEPAPAAEATEPAPAEPAVADSNAEPEPPAENTSAVTETPAPTEIAKEGAVAEEAAKTDVAQATEPGKLATTADLKLDSSSTSGVPKVENAEAELTKATSELANLNGFSDGNQIQPFQTELSLGSKAGTNVDTRLEPNAPVGSEALPTSPLPAALPTGLPVGILESTVMDSETDESELGEMGSNLILEMEADSASPSNSESTATTESISNLEINKDESTSESAD